MTRVMCVIVWAMAAASAVPGQEVAIVAEATVPGDAREAELDAFQAALRAVVDSAIVRVIGPGLATGFPREIESRIHAQRRAYVKSFAPLPVFEETDTPYDGRTYRRIRARVRLGVLADTLRAMGLAWTGPDGRTHPCEEVSVSFQGMPEDEVRRMEASLRAEKAITRSVSTIVTDRGLVVRFLVPGDVWSLARSIGSVGAGRLAVTAVQGTLIDVRMGAPSRPPSLVRTDLPPVEIQEVWIDEVFPARAACYRTKPLGRIVVARHAPERASRLDVEVTCPDYLEVPLTVHAGALGPCEVKTVPLVIPLSPARLMETTHETQALARVVVRCFSGAGVEEAASTVGFTVHGRNATDWEDVQSVCAFVTPEAEDVRRVASVAASLDLAAMADLPDPLLRGFGLVRTLAGLSLHYVPDPPSGGSSYDRVQFASETLTLRAGDCDDSAVLLASCLEGADIPTELLLTKDHVFAAFCTGVFEKDGFLVSADRTRYLVRDGMVWLPIETTLLAKGFLAAWDEGVRMFRELEKTGDYLERVLVRDGWRTYPPAAPTPSGVVPPLDRTGAKRELQEWMAAREAHLREVEARLRAALARDPHDHDAAYRFGVLLGRTGRRQEAKEVFAAIPDAHDLGAWARVGQGNCELLEAHADSAVRYYAHATELAPHDPVPWVNLGVALLVSEDTEGASEAFARALACVGGNEEALARLLGVRLEEEVAKADDAEGRQVLSHAEVLALMRRAREAHAGRQVAERAPHRHKFAGRKALDPHQRLKAQRLVCWPQPQV